MRLFLFIGTERRPFLSSSEVCSKRSKGNLRSTKRWRFKRERYRNNHELKMELPHSRWLTARNAPTILFIVYIRKHTLCTFISSTTQNLWNSAKITTHRLNHHVASILIFVFWMSPLGKKLYLYTGLMFCLYLSTFYSTKPRMKWNDFKWYRPPVICFESASA